LADFLRTDHTHLQALQPSSEAAQELKLLTEDYQQQIRQQTRLVNQLTATLKAYYPRALEIAALPTPLAREFLQAYPTPEAAAALTERQWQRWARAHRLSETRTQALWDVLQQPQLPVPVHVLRAKARLMRSLVAQLTLVVAVVEEYREAIEDFFRTHAGGAVARTLPIGKHGITAPTLWARLGDAPGRWESFRHLQAHAGAVPVTKRSGKQQRVIQFRFRLRQGVALRDRPRGVPLAALECLGPRLLRPAAGAGTRSSPGAPGAGREMVEDHLRHVATPGPV